MSIKSATQYWQPQGTEKDTHGHTRTHTRTHTHTRAHTRARAHTLATFTLQLSVSQIFFFKVLA